MQQEIARALKSIIPSHIPCDGVDNKPDFNGLECVVQQDFHDVLCLHKEQRKDGMEFAELIQTTRVDNVILRRLGGNLIEGTLCLTSHHLIFSSRGEENDELMVRYDL